MKKYIILLVVFFSVALSGCYKEDPIVVEKDNYWRNYDVNSKDPAFKYVSEYFTKHDKVLLYDAQVRDYVYNFQAKNKVDIVNPTTKIYEKLKFLEEVFLSQWSDKAIKSTFPHNIILAEKIIYNGGWSPSEKDMYPASNFLAFQVTDDMLLYSAAQKKALSLKIFKMMLFDYGFAFGKIPLDPKFHSLSERWYGQYQYRDAVWIDGKVDENDKDPIDVAYVKGILYQESGFDRWGDVPNQVRTYFGSKERCPKDYLDMLLKWKDEDIAATRAKFPILNQKAQIFIDLLESLDVDYKTLK